MVMNDLPCRFEHWRHALGAIFRPRAKLFGSSVCLELMFHPFTQEDWTDGDMRQQSLATLAERAMAGMTVNKSEAGLIG